MEDCWYCQLLVIGLPCFMLLIKDLFKSYTLFQHVSSFCEKNTILESSDLQQREGTSLLINVFNPLLKKSCGFLRATRKRWKDKESSCIFHVRSHFLWAGAFTRLSFSTVARISLVFGTDLSIARISKSCWQIIGSLPSIHQLRKREKQH